MRFVDYDGLEMIGWEPFQASLAVCRYTFCWIIAKWNGYPKGGEKGALVRAWDKTQKSWIPLERAQ